MTKFQDEPQTQEAITSQEEKCIWCLQSIPVGTLALSHDWGVWGVNWQHRIGECVDMSRKETK